MVHLGKSTERAMAMDDRVWRRHANPWSVYTRIPLLLLFALAIWSRAWIGWCAAPIVALLLVWTWVNPRVFPAPKNPDTWASKATFGERVWLNAKAGPIPQSHARWALGLSAASALAMLPMAYGLYVFDPFAAFLGAALASVLKLWFVDRMARLFDDMKDKHPPYRLWLES